MPRLAFLSALLFWLTAGATAQAAEAAPKPLDCPPSVGAGVACLSGRDANGAWYVIAVPATWNRRLIVHAHGGPRMAPPEAKDPLEDLDRFSVMVRAGYAWIGTTYRRGGYGVRMAAEDTDASRRTFWARFGRPEMTILHGQSWGGNVAAKASELYAIDADGRGNYDGVLLTSGVLSGGTRAYGFRADLRAVYQYYCRNHPHPTEAAYPLWQGLPRDGRLTRAELRARIDACTGVDRLTASRSPEQAKRLANILAVTGIREDQLVSHMAWATFLFQDLVQERLGGRNPFDNSATIYSGSSDDPALNAGVERFTADPEAVARLAYDSDLSGLIILPTLTLHALHDPIASFGAEAIYARTVAEAGRGSLLVQAATSEAEHSKLADAEYLVVLNALVEWIKGGQRPDPGRFQALCLAMPAPPQQCRFIGLPGSTVANQTPTR